MSRFTPELVKKVSLLSRLEFTEAEAGAFAGQLSRILDYVDKLSALDTTDVEPTSHALALVNAPEHEAQCYRVPPILQEL
jgi:aspartyl-tRNA(Asn)/glutamyl-tRNA(Gln) amidotransferase subunit C